ncbi:MAG: glycolate oxidase subunit GlcE [Rhodocyclales bacterium]|nr:glycolate oxidase subunit GlcE [Rhodocyclales bacterium]
MSDDRDIAEELAARVAAAAGPLRIRGGGSKDFYGNALQGEVLDVAGHRGIVAYEPAELVVVARAGTPLAAIEQTLAAQGQMLAFEPPHFGGSDATANANATFGGAIASGLAGPRRAAVGSLRDFVLGVKLLDGQGRTLNFGGRVMKNVAGYDVSRLIAGSLGTLGVILEAALKVLPQAKAEMTLRFELPQAQALAAMNQWAGQPLPISASAWHDDVLTLRLSGAAQGVAAAAKKLGGETVPQAEAAAFWQDLREQRLDYFRDDEALWRLALPSTAAAPELPGPTLIEWNGSQRWLRSGAAAASIRAATAKLGGHATLFRGGDKTHGVFQPLPPALAALNQRVRQALDARGVFATGRL